MAILHVNVSFDRVDWNGTTYSTLKFTADQLSGSPEVSCPIQWGTTQNLSALPFPVFVVDDYAGALAYHAAIQKPLLLARVNAEAGAPTVYTDWVIETENTDSVVAIYPGVTAVGGVVTIYLTTTGTAGGAALYKTIRNVQPYFVVADPTVAFGQPTVSADNKVLTIPCSKQTFAGVTVVGINVIGSTSLTTAPAGVALTAAVYGKLN